MNFCKEMIQPKELRIGNYFEYRIQDELDDRKEWWELSTIDSTDLQILESGIDDDYRAIPLTEENFLKHIDWVFEEGFNIKRQSYKFWEETYYLMENIIDGSGDFEVCFSKSKVTHDIEVSYWIDNERLEFMLSDTLHNFQNLFYISTGQDLPIKK